MKTKSFILLYHSLLLICVEAICGIEESKCDIGVDCHAYWPDGGPIWKDGVGAKTNDRCGGDSVVNFPGDRDGKWDGGGRWDCNGKGGNYIRRFYGEKWSKGIWGVNGKNAAGVTKGGTGRKKGDRGGRSINFPPNGKKGGNIMELESPDYEIEGDD